MSDILEKVIALRKIDSDSVFSFKSSKFGYSVYISLNGLDYLSNVYFKHPNDAINDAFEKISKITGIEI